MTDTGFKMNGYYLISWLLISTLSLTLLLSGFGFLMGVTVTQLHFPLAFILSACSAFLLARHYSLSIKAFAVSLALSAVIIVASILIAGNVYDLSADGQSYHQEIVYQLKNGWNPVKEKLADTVNMAIYDNHYGKGTEIPQSAVYALTKRIETGKATNFILFAATFCLLISLLQSFLKRPVKIIFLIALIATCNPIVLNQLFTFYVDGPMALLLLCTAALCILITTRPAVYHWAFLVIICILLGNVKFTGLIFVAFVFFSHLCYALIKKNWQLLKGSLISGIITLILTVGVVGFNPYILNTRNFGHPFYPLMGKNKVEIIKDNMPQSFYNKPQSKLFFISLFSHSNGNLDAQYQLKIPFMLNKSDIISAGKVDTRIAGFGPFFSGILLLGLALIVLVLGKTSLSAKTFGVLYISIALLLSVIIIPNAWWARYVPQFWYIPVWFLICAELYTPGNFRAIKAVLYATMIINICFTFSGLGWDLLMSRVAQYQVDKLKASKRIINVHFGFAASNRVRLQENGIKYKIVDLVPGTGIESFPHSEALFVNPDNVKNYPKSKLVQWGEKLNVKQ